MKIIILIIAFICWRTQHETKAPEGGRNFEIFYIVYVRRLRQSRGWTFNCGETPGNIVTVTSCTAACTLYNCNVAQFTGLGLSRKINSLPVNQCLGQPSAEYVHILICCCINKCVMVILGFSVMPQHFLLHCTLIAAHKSLASFCICHVWHSIKLENCAFCFINSIKIWRE